MTSEAKTVIRELERLSKDFDAIYAENPGGTINYYRTLAECYEKLGDRENLLKKVRKHI